MLSSEYQKERYHMKKLIWMLVTAMLLSSILAGCAASSVPDEKVYGKEDTQISVSTGDELTIELDENPTTGYQWSVAIGDESVIELSKDDYVSDNQDENVAGAGGTRVLTFKAKAAGNTVINMVYERSWEKSEDDETLAFQIEVK